MNASHVAIWTIVVAGVAVFVILWQHSLHASYLAGLIQNAPGDGTMGIRSPSSIYPQLSAGPISPSYDVGRALQAAGTAALGYPV